METETTVMWVDDDCPAEEFFLRNVRVIPAKNCGVAASVLEKNEGKPSWVVVDFLVPQGRWRNERLFEVPGIEFMRFLHAEYQGDINIAAYGIAVTREHYDGAKCAGARFVFTKTRRSFGDVLQSLKSQASGLEPQC